MLRLLNRRALATLALAGLTLFASAGGARAALILALSQSGVGTPIIATNPTASTTQITGTDVLVIVTAIDPSAVLATPFNAYLNLVANSVGIATTVGTDIRQDFAGTFTITSGLGGAGTNYLSGTFSDATFGSGTGLTMTASDITPGESLTFTSGVIPASHLNSPRAMSFAFAGVSPSAAIVDNTLRAFEAGVSANFSAAVPEPATVAAALTGLLVLGGTTLLRRQSAR